MSNHVNELDDVEATLGAIDRVMNKVEVETLASINTAYITCSSECGPRMQYLGAGYYVKRAPMVVRNMLERRKEQLEKEPVIQIKQDVPKHKEIPKDGDTIEIVERYDSSDEGAL
uniref:Uncharacterized protein n=1 Tax=Babesia bovis TaxID=5865 RepID=S6B0N4_BABBO|nr:hypothetical protein BEWA_015340 [Babesia bovis]